MLELALISITAFVALMFSFITATSVLDLKRKVGPLIDSANEMLEQRPLEQLNDNMTWMRNFAASAPNVMMDTMEGVIDDKIKHVVAEIECTKQDVLEFANGYGQQALAGIAGIFQSEGASILGKKGREKSLANAQIKAAKDQMLRQGIESQLPEGISYDMVEAAANQMGYDMEDAKVWLQNPMVQNMLMNFMGGPKASPPPLPLRNPANGPQSRSSDYRPLGGQ
jgi:hypothetical protein